MSCFPPPGARLCTTCQNYAYDCGFQQAVRVESTWHHPACPTLRVGFSPYRHPAAGMAGLAEDVLAALAPQIHGLVKQAADESAAAAEAKAEVKIQEASDKARTYMILAGLGGGLLGGVLGWWLARPVRGPRRA